jgi:hypothetical protein
MNDLDQLKRFGIELDIPGNPVPPELRERALAGVTPAPTRLPTAARRPRLAWRLALAGGLAAALTAGGYLALLGWSSTQATQPGVSTPAGDEATRILHNAALVAYVSSEPVPQPGQFVFVESTDHYTTAVQQPDGSFKTVDNGVQVRQVWSSVDGTQSGLVRTRPAADPNGWSAQTVLPPDARGYRTDLPTAPAAMLTWLYANSHGDNQRDEQAFITASDLVAGMYLTPQVQAALYEAVAKIPGITALPDVVDLAGRHGVAVGMGHLDPSHPADGRGPAIARNAMIFDPTNSTYLGSGVNARLRQATVDQAGQLP